MGGFYRKIKMWFKNLTLFRLSPTWTPSSDELEALLKENQFLPNQLSAHQVVNVGWSPFFEEEGTLVHKIEHNYLIKLTVEKKLLPPSVINQHTKEKVKEVEERQGFKVGRKQMKEIKENVISSLRPKAFSVYQDIKVWLDIKNHWLIINTASKSKSDEVIEALAQVLGEPLPILSFWTEISPSFAMTQWLIDGYPPDNFTIDSNSELKSKADTRIGIKYSNQRPEQDEITHHITQGKQCTRLELTWNDRISFVLDASSNIRNITPLEVLKDTKQEEDKNIIESFDAEMLLMFGELNGLLNDLIQALGGEIKFS